MILTDEELNFIWEKWSVMPASEIGRRLKIHKTRIKKAYQLLGLPTCPLYKKTTWVQPSLRPIVIQHDRKRKAYPSNDSLTGIDEDDLRWQHYWSLSKEQRRKLAPPN